MHFNVECKNSLNVDFSMKIYLIAHGAITKIQRQKFSVRSMGRSDKNHKNSKIYIRCTSKECLGK